MREPAHRPRFTLAEYLDLEERSNLRHEHVDGEIVALAGGTPEHGAMCARVIALLIAGIGDGPCRVFTSDVRVRIQATGLDTCPDASVVCHRVVRDAEDRYAIVNPVLLVEVTSPRTEAYDRGAKLSQYRTIESLREVLLVAHDEARIDRWAQDERGRWRVAPYRPGDRMELASLACVLAVSDVFHDPLHRDG